MSFVLRKHESMRKALPRLGDKRLKKALKDLRRCESLEAVHEIRKGIKETRALLRLFRSALKKSDFCRCNQALRKAAKCLDAARDAHVKLSTFRELARGRRKDANSLKIQRALEEICARELEKIEGKKIRSATAKHLKEARRHVRSLKVSDPGWEAIAPGIERSYCCGQRAADKARVSGAPDHFHDWRKRVKDLYYQFELLCGIDNPRLRRDRDRLKALGQKLGDDHDIVVLTAPDPEKRNAARQFDFTPLQPLIDARQKKLRQASFRLGEELYGEAPEVFCRRMKSLWKQWRNS